MRRSLVLLIVGCLTLLGLAAVAPPPSSAAAPISGRLLDAISGHAVPGALLRLRRLADDGGLGAIVDTTTTAANGSFSLDAGPMPQDEYYVQLVAGDHQGGVVGGEPPYVQPSVDYAATYGVGSDLGDVGANPAYIRGRVVDAATGRALRRVTVSVRTGQHLGTVQASDVTDARGRFSLDGITCEDDCALRLQGQRVRHESGYRACNAGVVPTWGAACASAIGYIGSVRLDHL